MENIYLSSISTFFMGVFVLLFEYFVIIPVTRRTELLQKKSDNESPADQQVIKTKKSPFVNTTIFSAFLWFINLVSFLVLLFAATRLNTLTNLISSEIKYFEQFEVNIFSDQFLLASLYCVLVVFSIWVPSASIKKGIYPLFDLFHIMLSLGLLLPIFSIVASLVFCGVVIVLELNLLYMLKPLGGIFFCVYILVAVINYLRRRILSNPKIDTALTD